MEGARLPALRTLPALSFYVLRVEYLVWAGSPDRYVRKIILFSKKKGGQVNFSFFRSPQDESSVAKFFVFVAVRRCTC